jgi:HTH-type transcriptional repressor of NAD biosynthesis genes
MTTGLVIGKFYPPHKGHHFVIDTALSECDHVVVFVLAHSQESISADDRVAWLRDRHPRATVEGFVNDMKVDYSSRECDKAWAKAIVNYYIHFYYGGTPIDRLYSSEEYGIRLADDLTDELKAYSFLPEWLENGRVEHRMVDLKRVALPISATQIRRNPVAHWDYLAPATKAGLTKRVVVCGAESTGTTTLTEALAERYQTVWAPEFGRYYSQGLGSHHKWTSDDFKVIIEEQDRLEELMARRAGPIMFCDTDGLATCMFHELYMKDVAPPRHYNMLGPIVSKHDLYIVTAPEGVPFEDDGYRLFPAEREWASRWFKEPLADSGRPYMWATGSHEERMDSVINVIESDVLDWDFVPPIDEEV